MRKERWCLQNLSLMAKRFQHSSLDSDEKFKADRISQLPDEILASILSFLTTKEASTTSVLSSRWRTLWRLTSSLNFDCSKKASEREWDSWALRRERIRFAIWVKRVLEVYRGSKLDEFIVSFDLTCNSRCSLNKWMAFAMSKRLKRLEISLAPFSPTELRFDDERYGFPIYCYNFIREPQGGSYGGKREKLQVVNLPHLVDLHLGGPEICITEDFGACSSNFSRLMTLKIVITETCMDKEARLEFPKFPALTNLKHLIFKTEYDLCSIRGVPLLIKSSPLLHKFTLELTDCSRCKLKRRVRKNTNCPHPNLRIVEIVGFVGGAVEFEFVMFFLENASALEKIILHPLDPISPSEAENKKQLSRARVRAERFKTRFSSRVEVVYYVMR